MEDEGRTEVEGDADGEGCPESAGFVPMEGDGPVVGMGVGVKMGVEIEVEVEATPGAGAAVVSADGEGDGVGVGQGCSRDVHSFQGMAGSPPNSFHSSRHRADHRA